MTAVMTASAQQWLAALARDERQPLVSRVRYGTLGPGWSQHLPDGVPEQLLCLLVAGECSGTIAGRSVTLRAGDALWLPPRTPLRVGGGPMTAYRLRMRVLSTPAQVPPFRQAPGAWELRPLFDAMVRDLADRHTLARIRARSLLVAVLAALLEHRQPDGTALARWQVEAVLRYVERRLRDRPGVRDLARVARLSEDAFGRRFRASFGQPPRSWLVSRRIHAAAQHLDDSAEPIGAVAAYYGYSDVFFFSRQFKAVTGMSPRSWRQRHAPGHERQAN
ncbi:MAG: helix-turn-helix domain-containing protein [Micromonosporaceae bacterium]